MAGAILPNEKLYKNRDWLYQKYINERKNGYEIGNLCDVANWTIYRWLRKLNIKSRTPGESQKGKPGWSKGRKWENEPRLLHGENHPHWNGGKLKRSGYVFILKPEHPNADHLGYVREHVFIASKALGRPLRKNEIVHHINGIKDDNRNCNLLICDKNYHHWLEKRMVKLYQQEHFGGAS